MKTFLVVSILALGFAAQANAATAFSVTCSGIYKNTNNDPMIMIVQTNQGLDKLQVSVRFAPSTTKPVPQHVTLKEYQISESMKGFPASYIIASNNQNFPDGVNETANLTVQSEIVSSSGNPAKLNLKSTGGLAGIETARTFDLTCVIAQ